jgi:hypothetical protein
MKYDSKTKTMDYTKKEKEHVFSSFPKDKSTPRSKALKKGPIDKHLEQYKGGSSGKVGNMTGFAKMQPK